MSPLALVSINQSRPVSLRLAHDIRNVVATVALHLETLERLAGPRGSKAASAANALIVKAAAMCNEALQEQSSADAPIRRSGFDIVKVIRQVVELVAPIAPEGFAIRIHAAGAIVALGNPQEVFRILFNLAHNAVMVARRSKQMSRIDFFVERTAATIMVRVSDDGPGLPELVRSQLFRRSSSRLATGRKGYGLAIARELAERNGSTLELTPTEAGTSFTLVISALATMALKEGPVTRSLGKRVAPHLAMPRALAASSSSQLAPPVELAG